MSEKIATREAYGKALVELGAVNDKVVVLDADLAGATMTKHFKAAYPERFFDCGIAEANMMNIGAGLSTMGLVPFCSTFAMFGAGRAYEQIRNSIAYPKFNVKICCSHAGVSVGEDGGSHQAIEDIGLMRLVPGMTVIVPADAKEARKATFALAGFQGPAYMRLARLATPVFEEDYPFEIGKANVLREGKDAAVFACGLMVNETLEAAKLLAAEQDVLLGDALLLAVDGVGLGEHGAVSVSARPDARRASCSAARRPRRPACRPEKEVKKPWFLAHLW